VRYVLFGVAMTFPLAKPVASQPPYPKPLLHIKNGDMEIVGNHWQPENADEKVQDTRTYIHCKKRLGLCAFASDGALMGVRAEFLTIRSWTSRRILLTGEDWTRSPCWNASNYSVDVTNGKVYRIDIPGTQSNRIECRVAPYQSPQRRVFELEYLGARR
jgi:hypothetical protein